MPTVCSYMHLVDELRSLPGPVRLVGIDGLAGSGKTTFATRLARAAGNDVPVVHTDDFATHDEPMQWWPRMLTHVIEPLLAGRPATFHPYDWAARTTTAPVTVTPADLVLVEGVGATRSAWRDRLVLRVWVDAPREVRLRRGLERDGQELAEFWREWMAAEDGYVADERPQEHAHVILDGDPHQPHDPESEFCVLSGPRAAGAPSIPT